MRTLVIASSRENGGKGARGVSCWVIPAPFGSVIHRPQGRRGAGFVLGLCGLVDAHGFGPLIGIVALLARQFLGTLPEEVHQVVADRVVIGMLDDPGAGAGPGDRDLDRFRDAGEGTVGHQQDPVGQQDRLVDVMGDHEHGLFRAAPDLEQLFLDGAPRERIERAKGFIQQQQLGMVGEGARDGHALSHAARKLAGLAMHHVAFETHLGQEIAGVVLDLVAGPVGMPGLDAEGDVLEGREPRQERIVLEHDAPIQRGAGHFEPVHLDHAGGRFGEAGEDVHDGGLATARVTEDADEFALFDPEAGVFEHRHRAALPVGIGLGQAFYAEKWFRHGMAPYSA
mmetsp:Transcript_27893/g.52174  ORF Transcript_27893/g.52174 Transcript_27893/m.52174 type:complete len:340 (+) Transcript_27893:987-2006(+)